MRIEEYKTYDEADILRLYGSVGWTAYTASPEALRQGFAHSLLVLAAWEDGELLGILRAVGDGYTIVWIQDLLVFPAHQRRGVGSALLKAALDRYQDVRQIQLATDSTPKTAAFYKSMGLHPFSECGCCGFMR